ncbi:hypothetical protein H9L15_03470 [Sphingomonas daechungensis]|uniref:Uncharacterized protein n=2 Tax=Sphingomonas daechungensis TaxID=1176646 RepID=A0ABX6T495_9SPHN|nr:hypothetical protein H9L15_03470 [Sphingomonas daechungensis]
MSAFHPFPPRGTFDPLRTLGPKSLHAVGVRGWPSTAVAVVLDILIIAAVFWLVRRSSTQDGSGEGSGE